MPTDWTQIATAAIAGAAGLSGGVLTTMLASRSAAAHETRARRNELYCEMLTMLMNRRDATQTLSFAIHEAPPPDFDQDVVNSHDARLALHASDEVRRLARPCFRLLQRFWVSHTEQVPVDVDEHGLYIRHYELVRGKDQHTVGLHMRMALGGIHDELVKSIDALGAQMRKELGS